MEVMYGVCVGHLSCRHATPCIFSTASLSCRTSNASTTSADSGDCAAVSSAGAAVEVPTSGCTALGNTNGEDTAVDTGRVSDSPRNRDPVCGGVVAGTSCALPDVGGTSRYMVGDGVEVETGEFFFRLALGQGGGGEAHNAGRTLVVQGFHFSGYGRFSPPRNAQQTW